MNVPYLGFGQRSGLTIATAIMIIAAITLWIVFKRKDWL